MNAPEKNTRTASHFSSRSNSGTSTESESGGSPLEAMGIDGLNLESWAPEQWEEQAGDLVDQATHAVREKPLQSLGIAFGVGIAAGALLMAVTRSR